MSFISNSFSSMQFLKNGTVLVAKSTTAFLVISAASTAAGTALHEVSTTLLASKDAKMAAVGLNTRKASKIAFAFGKNVFLFVFIPTNAIYRGSFRGAKWILSSPK